MKKYPKVLKLKSGQEITLRLLTKDDMELLVQFFQSLPVEDRMYLRIDVMQRENIFKRFGSFDYNLRYPVISLYKGNIIGIGTLFRAEFGWIRNLGEIRIVVSRDFQRQGLCTILTRELFFHALTTDLFKIQAELMEEQESAISCFERLGFKKEAILRHHVTDIEGNRRNLILMSLDIQETWYLMEDVLSDKFYVT